MVWDDAPDAGPIGHDEQIELVGTNLRLKGTVSLGRFGRLTDLINASSGYVRVRDAQLLQRNGESSGLDLAELMVDQDEISFIAQAHAARPEPGSGVGFIEPVFADTVEARQAREFVMFTPGHTVTGRVHVFGQTDLAGFVDATDPRFVPVTGVTTRSLADRRIVSHYDFLLINRTQLIAAAEAAGRDETARVEDVAGG
ncbi:MAG: hypothetical protein ACJ77O_06735 [Chloroflexota bacterium]